jgi:glyoxylase-like metal-dependent hydrolase (beta-lactamase superfamily II)
MQITEHVHALRLPFEIRPAPGVVMKRFVYAYVITAGRSVCLIDTGVAGSHQVISEYLTSLGRGLSDVATVILTHAHPDHIGSLKALRSTCPCTVVAHNAERPWIEDVGLQARQRPVPGFESLVAGSVRVDRTVEDGQSLDLGEGLGAEVIHTPGHSPGSISLWLGLDRVLFTGDAVAVASGFPVYDDVMASVRSIQRLRSVPDVDVLLGSWDEPRRGSAIVTVLDEGLAYLQRIHGLVRQVVRRGGSIDPMDLCRQVIGRLGLPGMAANPMAARSLQAHLKVLDVEDLVRGS